MVNVDTVYQKVLVLANKEQRGYITPQEFNLYAKQAQLEIVNQYFYDLDQFSKRSRVGGYSTEYSDMVELINEKLAFLKMEDTVAGVVANTATDLVPVGGQTILRLGSVLTDDTAIQLEEFHEVTIDEFYRNESTPLTKTSNMFPCFYSIKSTVAGSNITSITLNTQLGNGNIKYTFIKKPEEVEWGYVVLGEKALYDSSTSIDFEVHPMEEIELVYKILKIAGISMKREDIVRSSQAMEALQNQNEKL